MMEKILDQNNLSGYAVQVEIVPGKWFFATDANSQMVVCPTKQSAKYLVQELTNLPDIKKTDLKIVPVQVSIRAG